METTKMKSLNMRVLVVFFMIFSAAILPFSGFILHEASNHGADNLRFLAMGFHNVASIVFATAAVLHVKFNWKAIINYLRDKKEKIIRYPKELAFAGITLIVMLFAATLHIIGQHLY